VGSPSILFVTPELAPWIKAGGLGDVAAALPCALRRAGADVRVLVPGYPALLAALGDTTSIELPELAPGLPAARLLAARAPGFDQELLVLDCRQCYERPGTPYQDDNGTDWPDNDVRFALLSRVAALLAGPRSPLTWKPDVVHCHDWPTALAPAYLALEPARTAHCLLTVHNLAFQGLFEADRLAALGLPMEWFTSDLLEFHGKLSFLKAGLVFADRISTVSQTYAQEILTPAFGCGLDGLLRHRADRLHAIINGIDDKVWNPADDPLIAVRYDGDSLDRKVANKAELQRTLGLQVTADLPLFASVGRLTHQKGVDLIARCAGAIAAQPAQLALLGRGERTVEAELERVAAEHPGAIAVRLAFDERLAHRFEAGADIFVMPSRFEPCGLNQMYSLRYGTPPVVRATGGLADTVIDTTPETLAAGTANGFVFDEATPEALGSALARASDAWRDRTTWRRLQRTGMAQDFSWDRSASRYLDLYRRR
jgi:starch synthase